MDAIPDAITGASAAPLWWDGLPARPERPPFRGDDHADVAIVGAGYTGLWTAYYLKLADPALYEPERLGEMETWQKKYAEVMEGLDRAEAMWLRAQEKLEAAA